MAEPREISPLDLIEHLEMEKSFVPQFWPTLEGMIAETLQNPLEQLPWQGRLFQGADTVKRRHFGSSVYLRGLVEFTNYCTQNCFYCGIRRDNKDLRRYRLSKNEILDCCETGYDLGFRTFVLQGGEDPWFTDERLGEIVSEIKKSWPESAVTLSVGERSRDSYRYLKAAGADRYLLRHEAAAEGLYSRLHPEAQRLSTRMEALENLRIAGFQVGAGFMVGTPTQSPRDLLEDLQFLYRFNPEMVGIGPFMPHGATPFAKELPGSLALTLVMVALTRLLLPEVLLPVTTALASLNVEGREKGLRAGGNVVMPNLSPEEVRKDYSLYDGKLYAGAEAAKSRNLIQEAIAKAGYTADMGRGDSPRFRR